MRLALNLLYSICILTSACVKHKAVRSDEKPADNYKVPIDRKGPDLVSTGAYLAELRSEANKLAPLYPGPLAAAYLAAVDTLAPITQREIYYAADEEHFYSPAQKNALPADQAAGLKSTTFDEAFYYSAFYGTPMTYAQPLSVLSRHGIESVDGIKVLDFGYGFMGHMKILAALGAHMHGVDVNPVLPALYSWPGDQGPVQVAGKERGSVRILHGKYPADPAVCEQVGTGYDLIMSKNVLKRGYIHPEREADPRKLVHLDVADKTFLDHLHRALKPGGHVLIYNVAPRQSPPDKPYIPWADGRCPFSPQQWQDSGFEVIVYDHNDTQATHTMGRTLGWDKKFKNRPGLPIDQLTTLYTLVRKPAGVK